MALFWLCVALLVAIAMLFMAWPLLIPHQAGTSTARDKKKLAILAIVIPLSALIMYAWWGNVDEIKLSNAIERSVMAASPAERRAAHQEIISILEQQTAHHADNFKSWYLLGEFYIHTQQYKKAADAFGHAVSIQSNDADALAQYAQAVYFAQGNKLTFTVTSVAEQALNINPEQPTALGLLGITAFENKRYQEAITYWQKALWIVGNQGAGSTTLKKGIDLAKSQLKEQGRWVSVDVRVKIDPSIAIKPSQWVLVYARNPRSKQPVASIRVHTSQLTDVITLDDTMFVPGGMPLSSANEIEVGAKLVETDKQAISQVISLPSKGAEIELLIK